MAIVFLSIAMPRISAAQLATWPVAEITPDPLTFPDTRVGQTAAAMTLTATNTDSRIPMYVFSASLADTTRFQIVADGCSGQVLQPRATCTIDVAFAPDSASSFSTTLSLIDTGRHIVDSATIEGRGVLPAVTLSAASVDFGDHVIGQPSESRVVTLTNTGTMLLSITDIAAGGVFSVADDCGTTLAPQASCTLDISFAPLAAQAYAGQVTITDDAADSPQTIALAGKGVAPGQPDIGFSTSSVDFGAVAVGLTSAPVTITASNTGTVPVVVTGVVASGSFAQTTSCVGTLAPGTQCTIDATFSPTAAGAATGTIVVTDDATDSPQTITLKGAGIPPGAPQASLSATSLAFADQEWGTTSAAQKLTLTNGGSSPLLIALTSIDSEQGPSFSKQDGCGQTTLAPGAACTISITFSPPTDGTFTSILSIADNAADSPQTVGLSGKGVEPVSGGGCAFLPAAGAAAPWVLLILSPVPWLFRGRGRR